MGETQKTVLEANGILGRVSVEFQLVDDYYSHVIWLQKNEKERISIFKSYENPSLPNVPCFTQLHRQGQTLFLTGANGPCHWSMSVELGEWQHNESESSPLQNNVFTFEDRYGLNAPENLRFDSRFEFLFFDVACRLKEGVSELGSEYSKSEEFVYVDPRGDLFNIVKQDSASPKFWLAFGTSPLNKSLDCNPSPQCLVSREPTTNLRFFPPDIPIEKYPATVQWSYGFWAM